MGLHTHVSPRVKTGHITVETTKEIKLDSLNTEAGWYWELCYIIILSAGRGVSLLAW